MRLRGQLAAALRGGTHDAEQAPVLRSVELAPDVSLSHPHAGETVAGVARLEADAAGDVALVMFQFSQDEGAWRPVKKADARAAEVEWDTTALADGDYRVRALVVGADRSTATSEPVAVTVSNAVPQPPTPSPQPPDPMPDPAPPAPDPEPMPGPDPAPPFPDPQPAPPPELVAVEPGTLKLWQLERLVAENPAEDPYVQTEREAVVYQLRNFAETDGTIPGQFDWMLYESFGDLLGRA